MNFVDYCILTKNYSSLNCIRSYNKCFAKTNKQINNAKLIAGMAGAATLGTGAGLWAGGAFDGDDGNTDVMSETPTEDQVSPTETQNTTTEGTKDTHTNQEATNEEQSKGNTTQSDGLTELEREYKAKIDDLAAQEKAQIDPIMEKYKDLSSQLDAKRKQYWGYLSDKPIFGKSDPDKDAANDRLGHEIEDIKTQMSNLIANKNAIEQKFWKEKNELIGGVYKTRRYNKD